MGFFDSEMERSFLKTAKKKGWVKDEPKQIVRTASAKVPTATGSVDVDICLLVNALREKGFEKQASDLESSFTHYKKAETEYRVMSETGEDLIEAAHPEGDTKIVDSKDGHGDVETDLSAQKKILEIAIKEPRKSSLAAAAELIKSAQYNEFDSGTPAAGGGSSAGGDTTYSLQKTKAALNALAAEIDKAQQMSFDDAMKTYLFGEGHKSSLFIALKGDYEKLSKYGGLLYALGNGGTEQEIYNQMVSDVNASPHYLANISKALGKQYKIAAQHGVLTDRLLSKINERPVVKNTPYYTGQTPGAQSAMQEKAQQEQNKWNEKAWPVARQIAREVDALRREAEQQVSNVTTALNYIKGNANILSGKIKKMAQRSTSTPKEIAIFADNLSKALPSLHNETQWPARLVRASGQDPSMIARHLGDIDYHAGALNKAAQSGLEDAIPAGRVRDTLGRLSSILRMIESNAAVQKKHSDEGTGLVTAIKEMQSALQKSVGAGFQNLKSTNSNFSDYKNYDDLDTDTMTVNEMIKKDLAQAGEV